VKNAFLKGDLHEEVYMTPPPGVSHKFGEVYKLQKAFYGLKQKPRAWFQKFSKVIVSLDFVTSHHDSTLFVKKTNAWRILLSLYVDDMIITSDGFDGIESLKIALSHCFTIKDFGVLHYFFGIKVVSSSKDYLLSQSKYIADLFERAWLTDNNIVNTYLKCMIFPIRWCSFDWFYFISNYYWESRPNIAHVVHVVSQFV